MKKVYQPTKKEEELYIRYQGFRLCFDNLHWEKGEKLYQLHKYCRCENCNYRELKRDPANWIVVSTYDMNKLDEMECFLKNWECGKLKKHDGPIFIRF